MVPLVTLLIPQHLTMIPQLEIIISNGPVHRISTRRLEDGLQGNQSRKLFNFAQHFSELLICFALRASTLNWHQWKPQENFKSEKWAAGLHFGARRSFMWIDKMHKLIIDVQHKCLRLLSFSLFWLKQTFVLQTIELLERRRLVPLLHYYPFPQNIKNWYLNISAALIMFEFLSTFPKSNTNLRAP